MESMTASFSARPSVRMDNMVVYSGPPAAKDQKVHPQRPAPTARARDDLLPAGTMRTGRAGAVENGSGSSTSNDDNYNDFTSNIATLTSREAASCNGPFDTSIPTETTAYYSFADMAFGTAIQPDMWDYIANGACTRSAAGSARNESTYIPSCSTMDVQYVCASAMLSAAALADPQQRTQDNIECTPLGSSCRPEVRFKSPSLAVMRAKACSADNAAPVDGSIGRDSPGKLVRTDHDDAPVAVYLATCNFPEETPSICVALETPPHQSSTPNGKDLHDEPWLQDQDTVTGEDATLVLAGDHHSCSASDQENSLHHETIQSGNGVTITEESGTACEENGICDSSDDDIVPWIPKRRRALLVNSGSAGRCDSRQPSMRRKRRQTHTAELTGRPAQCRTTASRMSSPPPNRRVAKARSGPWKNNTPTSTSTQDKCPVLTRALGFASEPSWEVDRIIGSASRHGKVFYKVQWEPTWEPAESLQGSADAAVAEFRSNNKRRRI